MKKLMLALASVASGVALANGITSANVVGYNTRSVNTGFSLSAPCFLTVGGGEYDIQDLKLGDDAQGEGSDQIQIVGAGGDVEATYVWLNSSVGYDPGWYDFDSWEPIEATITSGHGFLMYTEDANGLKITTSGEVAAKETTVPIPVGFSIRGNNSPVAIDIQTLTFADDAQGEGSDQIQIVGAGGDVEATYIWLNSSVGYDPGWYDFDSWEPIEATIKAGEGLLMYTESATTLTIPSALQ